MTDTQTALPLSRAQKVLRFPLIQLVAGFLLILIPWVIGESFILSLSLTGLWRSILAAAFTVPVAFGAYYVLVHFIERRDMTELGRSGAAREAAQGIAIGALLLSSILVILALAGAYRVMGMNSLIVLLAPLIFAVKSAVLEEILFRGVLFRLLERGLGSWIALAVSAVLFGGLHLTNENATVIGAVAIMLTGGIVLAAAFMLTRRLWLPMGIHFAVNFAQNGIIGSAVSGNEGGQGLLRGVLTGPEWLTGGVFGVEASIVTVLVGLVVSILFLWSAGERGNVIRLKGR